MDAEKKANTDLITVAGGVDLEVEYLDGQKETVKVRQIPISRITGFMMVMGNEGKTIELYCDKPEGWADTLSIESANAVADKGQVLNLPFFGAWWKRQAKWREMQSIPATDTGKEPKTTSGSASQSSPSPSPITTT